jgi:hypothetical protein
MAESKNISTELDEAFGTLALVNANDIDVFLKVIMSVDEKTAQNIRGEINHLMAKYIDADPDLKGKLIKNDYAQLNTQYLQSAHWKVLKGKFNALRDIISNSISNIIKNSYSFSNALGIINHYVYELPGVENFRSADDKLLAACSQYLHCDNDIKNMHNSICKTVLILHPDYDYQFIPVDKVSFDSISVNGALVGIRFAFTSEKFPRGSKGVLGYVYVDDLTEHIIEQIIKYFNNRGDVMYILEDTLAYIAKKRTQI